MELLREWQELVGATIGGIMALLVALIVAYQARRVDDETTATLLIGEFLRIDAMIRAARMSAEQHGLPADQRAFQLAEYLCTYRVRLSPLFDPSIARLNRYDVPLAACMLFASSFIRDTEPVLARLEEDITRLHAKMQPLRNHETVRREVDTVARAYTLIGQHSAFAIKLLNQMVLGYFPTWHKIRRHFHLLDWEKELNKLLEQGK